MTEDLSLNIPENNSGNDAQFVDRTESTLLSPDRETFSPTKGYNPIRFPEADENVEIQETEDVQKECNGVEDVQQSKDNELETKDDNGNEKLMTEVQRNAVSEIEGSKSDSSEEFKLPVQLDKENFVDRVETIIPVKTEVVISPVKSLKEPFKVTDNEKMNATKVSDHSQQPTDIDLSPLDSVSADDMKTEDMKEGTLNANKNNQVDNYSTTDLDLTEADALNNNQDVPVSIEAQTESKLTTVTVTTVSAKSDQIPGLETRSADMGPSKVVCDQNITFIDVKEVESEMTFSEMNMGLEQQTNEVVKPVEAVISAEDSSLQLSANENEVCKKTDESNAELEVQSEKVDDGTGDQQDSANKETVISSEQISMQYTDKEVDSTTNQAGTVISVQTMQDLKDLPVEIQEVEEKMESPQENVNSKTDEEFKTVSKQIVSAVFKDVETKLNVDEQSQFIDVGSETITNLQQQTESSIQVSQSIETQMIVPDSSQQLNAELTQTRTEAEQPKECIAKFEPIEVERKFKISENAEETISKLGGKLLRERTFTDVYFDDCNYTLTLSDSWLRQRDGVWELKTHVSIPGSTSTSTQYKEITDEEEIKCFLKDHFHKSGEEMQNLMKIVEDTGLTEFAEIQTTRKTYQLTGCTIDLDLTDFGFQVGEIEVMVDHPNKISAAINTIEQMAKQLGFGPLQMATYKV